RAQRRSRAVRRGRRAVDRRGYRAGPSRDRVRRRDQEARPVRRADEEARCRERLRPRVTLKVHEDRAAMSDILGRILATKTEEWAAAKRARPFDEVSKAAHGHSPARNFEAALRNKIAA